MQGGKYLHAVNFFAAAKRRLSPGTWVLGLKYLSAITMPRGLDHIVHAVRDLDAAAEFYRRAGFTVGVRVDTPRGIA